MEMFTSIMSIALPILIAIGVIVLLASGYLKAPPDVAFVISGLRKKPRILVGQAGIKIPFFERVDKLALGAIQIDVKTSSAVPTAEYINVRVDSNVNVRVGQSEQMIELACQNFLNLPREEINRKVRDLLEGNVREIIGQMKLTEMVSDRKAFSEKVQENAVPDLARFGLELVSFNVQNFMDENGVIDNLGIDNVEQIRKKAAIAKSDAQRENAKASNDAKVQAAEEIAKRNNDLAIKQAELKKESDTKKAEADAAMAIEAENQRKAKEIAFANANLAKQEKEIELKEREVAIKERALEAEVKKTAEAQKYAEQQKADAKLYATQKDSEAELYERMKKAEAEKVEAEKKAEAEKALADALKVKALAEAEGARALGEAEAAAIRAKAEAEAEGLMKKAEAMKLYGEAAKMDMQMEALKLYFEQLPAIAQAVGEGYQGVDKIVMLGNDSGQLAGNIMSTTTQISEGLSQSIGIDLKTLMAGLIGGKIASASESNE